MHKNAVPLIIWELLNDNCRTVFRHSAELTPQSAHNEDDETATTPFQSLPP